MTYVCIKPACGPTCCDCNCAISEQDFRALIRRVDCPTCEAIAGEPCNTEVRNPLVGEWPFKAVTPHQSRRRAAAALASKETPK